MELRLSLILSVLLNLSVYSCFSQEYSNTHYDVNTIDGKPIVCDAVACSPEGHFLIHYACFFGRPIILPFTEYSTKSAAGIGREQAAQCKMQERGQACGTRVIIRFPRYNIFLQKILYDQDCTS